jgi:hypothetical protein
VRECANIGRSVRITRFGIVVGHGGTSLGGTFLGGALARGHRRVRAYTGLSNLGPMAGPKSSPGPPKLILADT